MSTRWSSGSASRPADAEPHAHTLLLLARRAMNCTEPIRRNARILPDAPALERTDGTIITYAVLDRMLDALAHRLRSLGLHPGHTVLIATSDGHRYLVAMLALARIGVTAAPSGLPPAVADLVLADASADGIAHSRVVALRDLWPAAGGFRGLPFAAPPSGSSPASGRPGELAGSAPPPAAMHHDGNAVALLAASSGTTAGDAKLIPITHDGLARRVMQRITNPPLLSGTRHCCFVHPLVSYGLLAVLRTLWTGCTAIEPDLHAEQASWLTASRVSHISISPIGLRRLLDVLPTRRVACDLRTIEIGGGVLPAATYALAQERLPATVIASYGSTETGSVAAAPFAGIVGRSDAAGYVLPGVMAQVVDADDQPLPSGVEGILRIRSASTATGYRGNPTASAKVFRNGWVYPNDRAVFDSDGLLRVTGRTDDVVVVEGAKVNPQAVETALMSLADLREAAVFGVHDSELTGLCAAIVPNGALDADDFHARCRERLGARAPLLILHLSELPRNAMGKVRRTELARLVVEAQRARATPPQGGAPPPHDM